MIVRRVWPARASGWPDIDRVRRDMFQLFDAIDQRPADASAGVSPLVNVTQDAEAFYVRAELPGVALTDLKLQTQRNQLVLEGKRSLHREERVSWHRKEREEGAFNRSVALPSPIDAEKVEARYADGILTVILPKAAEHKPRTIAIKTEGT